MVTAAAILASTAVQLEAPSHAIRMPSMRSYSAGVYSGPDGGGVTGPRWNGCRSSQARSAAVSERGSG